MGFLLLYNFIEKNPHYVRKNAKKLFYSLLCEIPAGPKQKITFSHFFRCLKNTKNRDFRLFREFESKFGLFGKKKTFAVTLGHLAKNGVFGGLGPQNPIFGRFFRAFFAIFRPENFAVFRHFSPAKKIFGTEFGFSKNGNFPEFPGAGNFPEFPENRQVAYFRIIRGPGPGNFPEFPGISRFSPFSTPPAKFSCFYVPFFFGFSPDFSGISRNFPEFPAPGTPGK